MSIGETACTYALLILEDEKIAVTILSQLMQWKGGVERKKRSFREEAEKISTLLKSANVEVESYWASLFAKLAEKKKIGDLIASAGGGGAPVAVVAAPAAVAGGAAAATAPAAEEKKKEEPQEESDDDMGFGLFD